MHWNAVVRFVLECGHIFHLFGLSELLAALFPTAAFGDYISPVFELFFLHDPRVLSAFV